MDTDRNLVALGLVFAGLISIGLGIWTRLGRNRTWYLVPNYYVLLPKGGRYALPIMGLAIILMGASLFMPTPALARSLWLYGVFPLMFLSLLIVIFQPKWLKPAWVRWLEENHGDILEILIEEARKTPDWRDWGKRVSTQEGLEEWVGEVRRKRNLPKR